MFLQALEDFVVDALADRRRFWKEIGHDSVGLECLIQPARKRLVGSTVADECALHENLQEIVVQRTTTINHVLGEDLGHATSSMKRFSPGCRIDRMTVLASIVDGPPCRRSRTSQNALTSQSEKSG